MLNLAQLSKNLAFAVVFVFVVLNHESASQNITAKQQTRNFSFPTLYWATPRPISGMAWHAVFGGTVIEIKKGKQNLSENLDRKIVSGAIQIEKIFLNLPDGEKISINDKFYGEAFEDLRKGDKVIVFINGFYEKEFVRIAIDGTNSGLGFKVKDWNEPIVSALERIAPCGKIMETTPEGHKKDFRVKLYDCRAERDKMILENAEIWKRYDPKGFDELVEMEKFQTENQNQTENQ